MNQFWKTMNLDVSKMNKQSNIYLKIKAFNPKYHLYNYFINDINNLPCYHSNKQLVTL